MEHNKRCRNCPAQDGENGNPQIICDLNRALDSDFKPVFIRMKLRLKYLACRYCRSLIPMYEPFNEVIYAVYQALRKDNCRDDGYIAQSAENHLLNCCRSEKRYRNFLNKHKKEITCRFDRPVSYPPMADIELSDPKVKFNWNYQGIRFLDEAVMERTITKIEAEILTGHLCYEKSFKELADELNIKPSEVIIAYEEGLKKLRKEIQL